MSRLRPARFAGIVAWTAVATGWVAALITRVAPPVPQAAQIAVPSGSTVGVVDAVPAAAVPVLPDGGLVIIRSVPRVAEPGVETRIVVQQPSVVEPAPPRVVSSGS